MSHLASWKVPSMSQDNMKSALTNEAKRQEQTFGLRSVSVYARMFLYAGVQFLSKCKAEF